MNNYIIHNYIDNRKELISYLQKINYLNPHYLVRDIEDQHLSNYEFINNVILVASNNSVNLSGKTYNFAGMFRKVLSNLRIHSFFCNNTHHGLFKTLNNKDCGFFKKELFDYFSDKPEMIEKYTNLFFEINSGVKMNTDVAFRNHEQDLNILNINLNNIYINHDHDNYKNNIFFSQHLKKYFNANYDKMPKMDKEYLSLCDVSFYESLSNDQDQENHDEDKQDKVLPVSINGDKAKEIWKNTVDVLCTQESSYRHWLSGTTAYDYDYQDQKFLVTCATTFCKEMIEERMKGEIEKLLSNQLDKEMELEVL